MNSPIAVWTVTYLLHSTLLVAAVWVAARWIRSASARDTLWKVALTGGLLTATLQTVAPLERIAPAATAPRVTFDQTTITRVAPALVAPPALAPSPVPFDWRRLVLPFWTAISFGLLLRLLFGHRRFLAALGPRVEVVTGPDREILDRLCARAGLSRSVRLAQAHGLASPVAMLGFEIVVPAALFSRLGDEQRATILAHELGHLVRRDPLWLLAGETVQALFFFQPLNRLARARLRETAEFLCDDAAVLSTGDGKALAETLAELAAHPVSGPPAVAAMAEGGSNLVTRVARVLHAVPVPPLRLRARLTLALGVTAMVAVFAPGMVATAVRASSKSVKDNPFNASTVNSFSDANLSQTFEGPEGTTHVRMDAHEFEITLDGRKMRALKSDGYFRATQTSERGPKRRVEVTPGKGGELVQRYWEDGELKPWCDDARRVAIAGFRAEDAYADVAVEGGVPGGVVGGVVGGVEGGVPGGVVGGVRGTPRTLTDPHTWGANIELTGTADGIPTYLRIQAADIAMDFATGMVEIPRGGSIEVTERHGKSERRFRVDGQGRRFSGDFGTLEQNAWLARILHKQTDLPESVIDTLAR